MTAAAGWSTIPYRFRARLMDWYQGWRDGRAGIPDPEISRGRVSTPHREALIQLALEVFDHERLRYEQARGDAPARIAAITARLDQLRAHEADARQHLAEVSAPLPHAELTWRRIGDLPRPDKVVIQRRRVEQRRRGAAARLTLNSILAEIGRVEADLAAANEAEQRELKAASLRVYLFHEHIRRRLASYLRTLIRHHFDGEWAREYLTIDPFLPGWITPEVIPPPPPETVILPASSEDTPVDDEPPTIIRLDPSGETAFGSAQPEPYTIDDPGTAAKHFSLTPEGPDKLRLRDFGWGNGPYRNGLIVKYDLLEAGDYFDFADHRYTVLSGCTAVERTRLPRVMLVVSGLDAEARTRLFARRKPKRLLTAMTFVQEKSTVVAVVGGSGAGKSSLLNVLIGDVAATSGRAYFDKLDILGRPAQLRDQLGYVPQDVDLFEALTVNQALEYSFRLRYPGPASRGRRRIDEVCAELQLTKQREQLIGTLSGGQKRRVSIAIELLSKPNLLILDEPTSGLDPGMDRAIMVQLRRYATTEGKTVLVTTHNVAHLKGTVDNVLVVGDSGRPVFFGAPGTVHRDLRVHSYAELMDQLTPLVGNQPSSWSLAKAGAYQRTQGVQRARDTARELGALAARPVQRARRGSARRFGRQFTTLVRRQVTLLLVRSRKTTGLSVWTTIGALQPYLIAAAGAGLAAWITSAGGLGPHPGRSASTAIGVLTTLTMLSGQALTYSDLVAEFPIIRREHRTGIGIPAIMLAKWLVFAVVAAIQAALIAAVFTLIKPGPAYSNLLPPLIELWSDLAVLAIGAMSLGLLISALSARLEQAVAWVTLASIGQIALNGITAPLPHSLPWLAAWLPDRWGVSAVASSVDLNRITVPALPPDALWAHTGPHWLFDLSVAGLLAACYLLLAAYVLWRRLRPARPPSQRVAAWPGGRR